MISKQTKFWTMKVGDKIRICDMDDSHLLNTIRMIQRQGRVAKIQFSVTPCPFGGHAEEGFEDEQTRAIEQCLDEFCDENYPIYEPLTLDAERRGLYPYPLGD